MRVIIAVIKINYIIIPVIVGYYLMYQRTENVFIVYIVSACLDSLTCRLLLPPYGVMNLTIICSDIDLSPQGVKPLTETKNDVSSVQFGICLGAISLSLIRISITEEYLEL